MVSLVVYKRSGAAIGLLLCVSGAIAQDAASIDPKAPEDRVVYLNPLAKVDRATLKGFRERPLFDPARRLLPTETPVIAAPVAVVAPEPPPSLQLLGVILGSRGMAVARRDGEEKTIVLRSGDQFGGWSVMIISPLVIRLQNGIRAFDYRLFGKPGEIRQVSVEPKDNVRNPPAKVGERTTGRARLRK